jgi:carbon-monoxide dehydrogenase small subunit
LAKSGEKLMSKYQITATINGDEMEFSCTADQPLLDVLRTELYLTGTKNGCGTGDCGACTVIYNGRPVNACLVLGVEVGGAKIETIEGMGSGDDLHPLQKEFLDSAALQCGICTPGVLNMAKALLEKNPDPTETEVRFGLAGNLCRCTGYDKIVRAVMKAAAEMRANGS